MFNTFYTMKGNDTMRDMFQKIRELKPKINTEEELVKDIKRKLPSHSDLSDFFDLLYKDGYDKQRVLDIDNTIVELDFFRKEIVVFEEGKDLYGYEQDYIFILIEVNKDDIVVNINSKYLNRVIKEYHKIENSVGITSLLTNTLKEKYNNLLTKIGYQKIGYQ